MDKEIRSYVIKYFSELMTEDERLALEHQMYLHKFSDNDPDNLIRKKMLLKSGKMTSEQRILDSFKDGYDDFELKVVDRIMIESPDKVYFNNCPKCNRLARTPFSKQCRHCGYDWHIWRNS